MPRENKKRGRRAEAQKRKHHETDQDDIDTPKKRRVEESALLDHQAHNELQQDYIPLEADPSQQTRTEFFGELSAQEQEYFKGADNTLDADEFENSEDKELFLDNVMAEAQGKELMLACSQSCSRLLERLVFFCKPSRLRSLFRTFTTHFPNLVRHRFASHCCEALFIKAASIVADDLHNHKSTSQSLQSDEDALESLFGQVVEELQPEWGSLMTDRFASHTLRILISVLAGEPLDTWSERSLLKSRKKESVIPRNLLQNASSTSTRPVPTSFKTAMESILLRTAQSLDDSQIRMLTVHPTGNPTLQTLLRLELSHFGRQKGQQEDSILFKIISPDLAKESEDSSSFITHLIYDPIGSRLVETIVQYSPSKTFKSLYKQVFKERMGSLARNDVAGYVVCKVLERLSPEELSQSLSSIVPQIPGLAERGRTYLLKVLVERCSIRNTGLDVLAQALRSAYPAEGAEPAIAIDKLLQIPTDVLDPESEHAATEEAKPATVVSTQHEQNAALEVHASLLIQAMLAAAPPLADLAFNALVDLPQSAFVYFACRPHLSRILQQALKSSRANLVFRRKLITRFYGHFAMLSLDVAGSHLVDAIWDGTNGMAFLRERVAEELAEAEPQLRESKVGRAVWRNWRMDLYKRKRGEWVRQMKDEVGNKGFLSFPDDDATSLGPQTEGSAPMTQPKDKMRRNTAFSNSLDSKRKVQGRRPSTGVHSSKLGKSSGKSNIQLARERFAKANNLKPPAAKNIVT